MAKPRSSAADLLQCHRFAPRAMGKQCMRAREQWPACAARLCRALALHLFILVLLNLPSSAAQQEGTPIKRARRAEGLGAGGRWFEVLFGGERREEEAGEMHETNLVFSLRESESEILAVTLLL